MTNPYGECAGKDWRKMADDLKAMAEELPAWSIPTPGHVATFTHFVAIGANLRAAEALCRQIADATKMAAPDDRIDLGTGR